MNEEDNEKIEELNEASYYDNEDLDLLEQIQHYDVNDFMMFNKTKEVLENEWEDKFNSSIEPKIENLFDYFKNLNHTGKILYKADDNHRRELVELVRYHIKKEYDTDIFKKYPKYARSFISFLDKQIK